MRLTHPLLFLWILLFVPIAQAEASQVHEIALPDEGKEPLALAFGPEGDLWMTLDGTWGLGRYDVESGDLRVYPLSSPKTDDRDSLWALRFGPDGHVWTGSKTHIHRIHPETGETTSFPVETPTILPGDIYVDDTGSVWYALVTVDRIAHLDPATGQVTEYATPGGLFGPLHFLDAGARGVYLTATYGDTYAKLDPATGALDAERADLLDGPVGIVDDGSTLWVAEMGGSTVARIDPATGERTRFTTISNPRFPASGPSDVLVAKDGAIWFAEHFADRIARLDVENRTLHEYLLPSAPGTEVQRIAEGPDGRIWFAEWATDKIGYVKFGDETPGFELPARVEARQGESIHLPLRMPEPLKFGLGSSGLKTTYENGEMIIDTSQAETGEHQLLVSVERGPAEVGKYLTVNVVAPPAEVPGPPVAVSLMAILGIALLRRQNR